MALIHATCVAVDGRGLLILGPSGAGKSSLALQMIALGAQLVADDRVQLVRRGADLFASAPVMIAGLIEARGIGLLKVPALQDIPINLAVDLGTSGGPRLPDRHDIVLLEKRIHLVNMSLHAHLPAALLLYMKGGRAD